MKAEATETHWIAVPGHGDHSSSVVERNEDRTVRVVAEGLTEEEAHGIANWRETRDVLEALLNVILEGEVVSPRLSSRAMQAFLASKGF